ncbi:MAG: fumarylacetoacetate hydrolase family protein, partial [Gammaproteobacteria bacterium]|nr:fumarylacetoacetate hydrolase family protein [Gammaproteobacteria bacterium]
MHWIRFERGGQTGFGTLRDGVIQVHEGDMFEGSSATSATVPLADVTLLTPCVPTKMIALWNNFHALAAKLNLTVPPEPLYLLKTPNSFLAGGQTIRVPASYAGKVVYEGELGVVIGKRASNVSEADAAQYIFGYTCSNDVTAAELIQKDPTFAQWTRAKSFDTFGVFGPVIATGLDPLGLSVKTLLDGKERQNYPVSDMIFKPAQIVSLISRDMTLYPGDV